MSIQWKVGRLARWLLAAALVLLLNPAQTVQAGGSTAPDFTLRDINGTAVTLSALKGQVVLINFWATWCGPCKQEMPHLNKIEQELGPQGFRVLSISTDDARTGSKVKAYVKSRGYGFTVLLDTDTTVVSQYNPSKSLPYSVLLNRSGKIAKVFQGYKPGDEVHLREEVKKLVESGK